jgi:hypothetical protein
MKAQMWPFVIIVVGLVAVGCACIITDILSDIAKNRRDGL